MSRLRVCIFVSLALVIVPLDAPVFGATRPTAAQKCAAAKIAAAAKKARADLTCRAKGALAAGPADSACLLKAQQAFDAALSRADRRGSCVAPGDAGNVAAAIDRGVADLAADVTGQCTTGCVEGCSGSFETCRWNGQTCGCGGSLGSCAAECSLLGTSGFCANAGDVCDLGTCSCVAESRSSACDAHKLEATGQALRAQLLCQVKATTSGGAVDPACITKAETTFDHAFDTAENAGACAVRGNALGVLDAMFPWVNGIANVAGLLGCGILRGEGGPLDIGTPAFLGIALDGSGDIFLPYQKQTAILALEPSGGSRVIFNPGFYFDSVAVDADGNVFASGFGDYLIYKFDNGLDPEPLTTWHPFELRGVTDIATDANGNLYVIGEGADVLVRPGLVQKYDNDGRFLTEFGTDALSNPTALAIGADGRIFVADGGDRIVEFGSDGTLVTDWHPFERINRVAVDPCGNVLITTDDTQGAIAKYTADGRFITSWNATSRFDGLPARPSGIAIYGSSGAIWTIDLSNANVKTFGCACTP